MLLSQRSLWDTGGVSRILQALFWLLRLQRAAVGAAGAAHLLGLSHPAHGLQVCVHGQGEETANRELYEPKRSYPLWLLFPQVERDERSDEESEAEEEPEEEGEECRREHRMGDINSKLTSLANNCMLNNLTNQRNINSRLPKAR